MPDEPERPMQEVPTFISPDRLPASGDPDFPTRLVSALAVELDTSSGLLTIRIRDPRDKNALAFVLSPPTARLLSRELRKKVKQYIRLADRRAGKDQK